MNHAPQHAASQTGSADPTRNEAIVQSISRLESLVRLHALVLNDNHAFIFQNMDQYRSAIATAIATEIRK